jgi:hypothetical protein
MLYPSELRGLTKVYRISVPQTQLTTAPKCPWSPFYLAGNPLIGSRPDTGLRFPALQLGSAIPLVPSTLRSTSLRRRIDEMPPATVETSSCLSRCAALACD